MEAITLMSFGALYGVPPEADTVIGTRGLPNPYYVPELKQKTGLEAAVRSYVFSTPEAEAYFESCLRLLRQRIALYQGYDSPLKEPLVIAVGCSGGRHRSVSMTLRLAEALRAEGVELRVLHRDLNKRLEHSAGVVAFTRQGGELRYAIIQSIHGHHGFPKGHMEPGETEQQTALRETLEETGLRARLIPGFRTVELYPLPKRKNRYKQVVYYLGEFKGQRPRPQPTEIRSVSLLPFRQALKVLEFEPSRRILSEAHAFLSARGG